MDNLGRRHPWGWKVNSHQFTVNSQRFRAGREGRAAMEATKMEQKEAVT